MKINTTLAEAAHIMLGADTGATSTGTNLGQVLESAPGHESLPTDIRTEKVEVTQQTTAAPGPGTALPTPVVPQQKQQFSASLFLAMILHYLKKSLIPAACAAIAVVATYFIVVNMYNKSSASSARLNDYNVGMFHRWSLNRDKNLLTTHTLNPVTGEQTWSTTSSKGRVYVRNNTSGQMDQVK